MVPSMGPPGPMIRSTADRCAIARSARRFDRFNQPLHRRGRDVARIDRPITFLKACPSASVTNSTPRAESAARVRLNDKAMDLAPRAASQQDERREQ